MNIFFTIFTLFSPLDSFFIITGPISISIFAPGFDAAFADIAIQRLKSCSAEISKFVTFHLVYPADFPADLAYPTGWDELSCEEFDEELKNFEVSLGPPDLVYPHNVLRNVARSGVSTEFVFLIDIDLVPNRSLRQDFLKSRFDITKYLYLNIYRIQIFFNFQYSVTEFSN